jgi:hypothetical protein
MKVDQIMQSHEVTSQLEQRLHDAQSEAEMLSTKLREVNLLLQSYEEKDAKYEQAKVGTFWICRWFLLLMVYIEIL